MGERHSAWAEQVFLAINGLRGDLRAVDDQAVVPVEKLMSEAYQAIDKAIGKVCPPFPPPPPLPQLPLQFLSQKQ